MVKSLFISGFISLLVFGALAVFSFSVSAATALETVVGECRQRTGFGEVTCKTLVKKYMNVERCKEYTGYSDEECAKKIEEIKKDPGFSGSQTAANVPSPNLSPNPSPPEVPVSRSRDTNGLSSLRERKERDLLVLWKRTEAVTNSLKSKGFDMATIEAAFPEFEKKAEELLAAYDVYLVAYERTKRDTPAARRSVRQDARDKVSQARRVFIEYYQARILLPLRTVHEQAL